MKIAIGFVLAALALEYALALAPSAWAHEGEVHSNEAPLPQLSSAAPRAVAKTEEFELVAVLDGATLTLFLDRFASNAPVVDARVEVESSGMKAIAAPVAPGVYSLSAVALPPSGQHALTISVEAGDVTDLLSVTLTVSAAPTVHVDKPARAWGKSLGWTAWGVGGVVGVVLLVGGGFLALRRRKSTTLSSAGVIVLLALAAADPAQAHGGEDHTPEPPPATVTSGPGPTATASTAAQRLADGSVFVPKPIQHQLALRTVLAKVGALAITLEFNGKVVPDPNAAGRVQASQAGRIEPGPLRLPSLGQAVIKGQVLAYLRPLPNSIERGNQQAQLAELESQLAIAERKVTRLAQLEGSVPQKEIEAARFELQGLQTRRAAVGASLNLPEALEAPVSGVISTVNVVAGQVVEAKESLFDIVDPARLAVEALAYDTAAIGAIKSATARIAGSDQLLDLQFVGSGRQLREQALPLFFRVLPQRTAVAVGQPVQVIAKTSRSLQGVAVPQAAIVRNGAGETVVWVHTDAERFEPRRVRFQSLDGNAVAVTSGIKSGERIVTEGASLLAQIR